MFYRRRLPHWYEIDRPVFVTWRLHGSLPPGQSFLNTRETSGRAFLATDQVLDRAARGPVYLRDPKVASLTVEAIQYASHDLKHYALHAFVVMANHVHLLITPQVPLPKLMNSLKGITARRANTLLGRTGQRFWQEESFDRLVRDGNEFNRIRQYIEENPVQAGLVTEASAFPWSSFAALGSRATL